VILSLFPLTSPIAMMTRLSATQVPFWQTALAVVLLLLTAVYLVRASAGLFHSQNLLSGKSMKPKAFLRALAGKE
jgi:ABC-2 type transport system permease protein